MIKNLILFVALTATVTASFAQYAEWDGTRYGKDEKTTIGNFNLVRDFVKAQDWENAYKFWDILYHEAPFCYSNMYTYGPRILRALIAASKDAAKQKEYAAILLDCNRRRLANIDRLNALTPESPLNEPALWQNLAHDYISYTPGANLDTAYSYTRKAVDLLKENCEYYTLGDLMKISSQLFKKDVSHRDALIQDYLDCANYINTAIANAEEEKILNNCRKAKDNIDAYFINSGAADAKSLQSIYGPKVEAAKTDAAFLNKVINLLKLLKCTDIDVYIKAVEYAYQIQPTSDSAEGLAYMYTKRNEHQKALDYLKQAISLEEDRFKKSDLNYTAAALTFEMKDKLATKEYLNKAIELNKNNGKAYILLAQLYAAYYKWTNEDALNRCTFLLAIEKLQLAKKADPSLASKADKLIADYSEYTPLTEDLFMIKIKPGDRVEIKDWINETITIK